MKLLTWRSARLVVKKREWLTQTSRTRRCKSPGKKRENRQRKRRRSSDATSSETASDGLTYQSPPTQKSPEKPLKDTEPEIYGIYATSDLSDGEEADVLTRPMHENSFISVNGTGQQSPRREPAPAPESERSEDEDPAPSRSPSPDLRPEVHIPASSNTRPKNDETAAQPSTTIPVPQKTANGRFNCPYADIHKCEVSFASRKSARRHAAVHTNEIICTVCQKPLGRKDVLKKHMKLHSASEKEAAEGGEAIESVGINMNGNDEIPRVTSDLNMSATHQSEPKVQSRRSLYVPIVSDTA